MAEEIKCVAVSAEFEEDGITTSYTSCWSQAVPDPGWSASNVTAGLRRSLTTEARAWRTCQYFMKGMSAVCNYWTDKKCSNTEKPSGYNDSHCDFLGRRNWCNKYKASADKLDEWVCVAPNPYLTGLTKRLESTESTIILTSVPQDEILGYNPSDTDVGKCDCYGMGRGQAGCAKVGMLETGSGNTRIERELEKLPVVCNYYRPWQMGFGAIAPHDVKLKDGSPDLETMLKLAETNVPYEFRMPLSFYVYNYRAKFQKCLWYDKEKGSNFIFHDTFNTIILEEEANGDPFTNDKLNFCVCPDSAALPYNTRVKGDDAPKNLIANIWAKAGTIICNGAKPECPCYSGQWLYNTDEKMWDGMPVTAQQIMELRFWSSNWDSQKEYDDFFARKPNLTGDPHTADIYTYTGWENLDPTGNTSVMKGKLVHMCQPAPMHLNYFDPKVYLTVTEMTYAKYGTTTPGQVYFANLIPLPRLPDRVELFIAYPYFNDDSLDESACSRGGQGVGYTKPTNETKFDKIYVMGYTEKSKNVFALNLTGIGETPSVVANYDNAYKLTSDERILLNSQLDEFTTRALESNFCYVGQTVSGKNTGVFITPPVQLLFGNNLFLICVNYGGGWEFKKRTVKSTWCGGYIIQQSYDYAPPPQASDGFIYQPFAIQPAPDITAKLIPAGGSDRETFTSHAVRSYWRPDTGVQYYSYSMVEVEFTETGSSFKWFSIGNSYFIWCEINNLDVNHIFPWEIIKNGDVCATMTYIAKLNPDGTKKTKKAIPNTVDMVSIDDINPNYIPPNVIILRPKDPTKIRVKFISNEWSLELKYKVVKLIDSGYVPSGVKVIAGAGLNDNSVYKAVDGLSTQGSNISAKTGKDTPAVMGIFKAPTTKRAICATATRLLSYITDVRCRGVDILYRYTVDGKEYVLVPNSGFSINPGGDLPVGMQTHTSFPLCGDHECGDPCYGPMWFPYDVCTDKDFYQTYAIAASCAQMHDGAPKRPGEYRYLGPEMYKARAEVRDASGSTCLVPFAYYYSNASAVEPTFTGYANIKGKVLADWYAANNWKMPPFGNDGRDLVERFISQEYFYHYDMSNPPKVVSEWVSMTMDHTAFYVSFNVFKDFRPNDGRPDDFDYSGADMAGLDSFYFINQINFMNYSTIGETRNLTTRYNWEDVFVPHSTAFAEYPPVARGDDYPIVDFYCFKEKDTVWAWRDLPRAIDRGESNARLNFVEEYKSLPYVFSFIKEEVRLVQDEGVFTVKYTGPTISEGTVSKSPTIGGRPFKILYGNPTNGIYTYSDSDYGTEYIEWLNEGGSEDDFGAVEEGASSRKDNFYEKYFASDWIFSQTEYPEVFQNIIFTDSMPDKPMEFIDSIEDGVVHKLKYRRGIAIDITKERLAFLPTDKSEKLITIPPPPPIEESEEEPGVPAGMDGTVFKGASFNWESEVPAAISKIVIKGKWGRVLIPPKKPGGSPTIQKFFMPGFSIAGTTLDGEGGYTPRGMPTLLPVEPDFGNVLKDYTISFFLPTSPIEMIKKVFVGDVSFTINGDAYGYVNISNLTMTTVTYKEECSEDIYIWERKYTVSKSSAITLNPDGPEKFLKGTNNGGLHFNFEYNPTATILRAENKIKGAHCSSKLYSIGEDTPISISMSNLFKIEANEQKKVYEDALKSDRNVYNKDYLTCPVPSLVAVAESNKILGVNDFGNSSCSFIGGPLLFSSHPLFSKFKQYPFWRLGGHKFIWGDAIEHTSCELERLSDGRIINATWEDVVSAKFQHINHGGEDEITSALNAYYSGQFYYEQARYDNYFGLTGQEPEGGLDLISASKVPDYYSH